MSKATFFPAGRVAVSGVVLVAGLAGSCVAAPRSTVIPAQPPLTAERTPVRELASTRQAELLADLRDRIRKRLSSNSRQVRPGDTPRPSSSLQATYTALAALQVKKAEDHLRRLQPSAAHDADRCLSLATDLLAVERPDAPPALVTRGRLLEHAYIARNDGSAQPYFLYVPSSYDGDTPLPLILFLHGWDPNMSRTQPWLVPDFVLDLAETHGVLFALPHGRTNTDFQYAGEVDVLRVEQEVKAFYEVDPDRVLLLGVSMGGAGAWQIGAHYPHRFAGVAPINGQGDWFRFWHEQFHYPPREALPSHLRWLIAMHNPADLARNLSSTYAYGQHAIRCFLGAGHTRDMIQRLKQFGGTCESFEDPSHLGHYIYLKRPCWEKAFRHLLRRKRQRYPADVRYTTYSLRFHRAYWLDILGFQTWGRPATVRAQYRAPGVLTVESTNIRALSLMPPADWSDPRDSFTITWNGRRRAARRPDPEGRLFLGPDPAGREDTALPVKNRAVCGPAADVFNFPFVAVTGTAGSPAETDACRSLARRFADDWENYAEGEVLIVEDTEVTPGMISKMGLVLFGLPHVNRVTARVAAGLPFSLAGDRIGLPDGRSFDSRRVGLLLTYPNPLAPDRYVLLYHGFPWGRGRSNNHKFDLVPDFVVYTEEVMQPVGINRYHAAGFFDVHWQYDPDLTDFPDRDGGPSGASAVTTIEE